MAGARTLASLNARIVACELCPRLRAHCSRWRGMRRRAYRDWEYWGRPVPSFGDPKARVTGAGTGAWSARIESHGAAVHRRRFGRFSVPGAARDWFRIAAQGNPTRRWHETERIMDHFGRAMRAAGKQADARRAAQLRSHGSIRRCSLLKNLRVVVCLGRIAFDGLLAHETRTGAVEVASRICFCAWGGIHTAGRADRDRQLSSVAAEHEHWKADATRCC